MKPFPGLWLLLLIVLLGGHKLSAQCNVDFTAVSLTDSCSDSAVVKISATGAPSGSIYYWNTGKGDIIGSSDYYFGYNATDTTYVYDVKLTVKQPDGTTCTKFKPRFLNFTPMSSPRLYVAKQLLCGDGTDANINIQDSTSGVAKRQWIIDGVAQTDTSRSINYTFTTAGAHHVMLNVTSVRGCIKSVTKMITVLSNVKIDFCAKMDENITGKSLTAVFTPMVDNRIKVTKFVWTFSGGTPSTMTTTTTAGTSPVIFSNLSTGHDVTLDVYTENGCHFSITKSSLVQKYYSVAKTDYCASDMAIITILGNSNGRTNFNFSSNFPMKMTNLGNNQYGLKFGKEGKPQITISFNYGMGSSCNSMVTAYNVFNIMAPVADFRTDQVKTCSVPAKIKFMPLDSSPASGINSYTWHLYDSTGAEIAGSPFKTTKPASASFTFNTSGFYTVREVVTNNNGCKDSMTKTNLLKLGAPSANVVFSKDTVCPSEIVHTKVYTSPTEDSKDPYYYYWYIQNVSDNTINRSYMQKEPDIMMTQPGTYDIYFRVGYDKYCINLYQFKSQMTVSGAVADFSAAPVSNSCPKYTYQLDAKVTANIPANSTVTSYKWDVLPSGGVIIANPNSASTTVTLPRSGCYTVRLSLINSIGCSQVIEKKDYICVGTVSSFRLDTLTCVGRQVVPNNTSNLSPDYYRWVVSPSSGVKILPNAAVKNPTITFDNDGCYNVMLVTGKNGSSCSDTATSRICVRTPSADFSSSDTTLYCQPKTVTFKNLAKNGSQYVWEIFLVNPDGTRTRKTMVTTTKPTDFTYTFSGNNGYYDVKLTATGGSGCDNIILRKNFIHIVGPQAYFTLDNHSSCGNQLYTFTNKSTDAKKVFIQYGDLSPATDTIGPHYYKFVDTSKDVNTYYPTIFAINEDVCAAVSFFTDTVKLYRPPIAGFRVNNTNVCAPETIVFKNTSRYGNSYKWNFGDGTPDTVTANTEPVKHTYTTPGKYTVRLIATTDKGCVDSMVIENYITVNRRPTVSIKASRLKVCYQDSITFSGSAVSDAGISSWAWKFDDPASGGMDTSSLRNPIYHFVGSGAHHVTLIATNKNGCSDSSKIVVSNNDSVPPGQPVIDYVTVNGKNVQIVFAKYNGTDFRKYHLYRVVNGNNIPLSSPPVPTNSKDTTGYDIAPQINVDADSSSYVITIEDECGFTSMPSVVHTTMHLRAYQNTPMSDLLTWSPYMGWSNVQSYDIYRATDKTNQFVRIASVPGTQLSYTDNSICNHLYTYYIRAVDADNASYTSASNRVDVQVNYVMQTTPLKLYRTSVMDNQYIETNWERSTLGNVKYYRIERFRSDYNGWQDYDVDTGTTYIDRNVDVSNIEYKYRVSVVDSCGNVSPSSNIGTSILLNSTVQDDSRHLSWNPYDAWDNGVQQYLVQLRDDQGQFQTLGVLPKGSAELIYSDDSTHDEIHNGTCYRIIALEDAPGLDQDTSTSNVRCVPLDSRLWIPNAFSPNDDKINDTWGVIALSLYSQTDRPTANFNLRVFNRWGQLVWETNDYEKKWDGTFNGKPSPEGLYMYQIKAEGVDGKEITRNGTLLLMR